MTLASSLFKGLVVSSKDSDLVSKANARDDLEAWTKKIVSMRSKSKILLT